MDGLLTLQNLHQYIVETCLRLVNIVTVTQDYLRPTAIAPNSPQVSIWCPLRRGTNRFWFMLMSAFPESGRSDTAKTTEMMGRFRPKGDITRAAFELGLVRNPVPLVNQPVDYNQ